MCQQPLPDDPRERQKICEKKRKVFLAKRTTSHWPLENKMFAERTRFGAPPSKFRLPKEEFELSPLGRLLAGFRDEPIVQSVKRKCKAPKSENDAAPMES